MKNINNKKHNFVTIRSQIYLLVSLDEVNRVFVGHKINKEIVDQMINGLDEESVENFTTILFREQGNHDVYIHSTVLNDFENMDYLFEPMRLYSEERYNIALNRITRYEEHKNGNWLEQRKAKKVSRDVNYEENVIKSYNDYLIGLEKHNKEIIIKKEWLVAIKEKWF